MAAQTEQETAERLIDVNEVAKRCGVKASRTILYWVGSDTEAARVPDFPKPQKIGGVKRWREADVNDWVRARFGRGK